MPEFSGVGTLFSGAMTPDPMEFAKMCWPDVYFYQKQREIIYSVRDSKQTFVPAGNKLGKDFVAGFIILWFFMTRHPCRIVTTSAKEDHLRVLWGEINNFIQTSRYSLNTIHGGPLIVHHQELLKVVKGERCPFSYTKGMVAAPDSIAAMQGHHIAKTGDGIPRAMFVADESSSVQNEFWEMAETWFDRGLAIGNTWPCENFFKYAIKGRPGTTDKGGDIKRDDGRYYRRVIHIRAQDTPNIKYALEQLERGEKPDNRLVVNGVKDYEEYLDNRKYWDASKQTVSLDAEFYEGTGEMVFPAAWLDRAHKIDDELKALGLATNRRGIAMGVDSAEGGDSSTWAIGDERGLIDLISLKTPDTSYVTSKTLQLMRYYNVPPEAILFDRGGGGKEHVDRLRLQGYPVQSIGFGEPAADPEKYRRGIRSETHRVDVDESKYAYRNRRAELYYTARKMLDPQGPCPEGYGIPRKFTELRRQMQPIPLLHDSEGRLELPPKRKRQLNKTAGTTLTMMDLLGCSPDEADAFVLMAYRLMNKRTKKKLGAFGAV